MLRQQGRIETAKDAGHKPRMLLFFLDEQIDSRLVNRVAGRCRPLAQVASFPAFAYLESLQRADQRFPQASFELDSLLPGDVHSVITIVLEVAQPVHRFSL